MRSASVHYSLLLAGSLLGGAIWGCNDEPANASLLEPGVEAGVADAGDALLDGGAATQAQDPFAYDDQQGVAWMVANCASCHGQFADGLTGIAYSSWQMSAEFTAGDPRAAVAELQVSSFTPAVYQTIYNAISLATVPSVMPPPPDPNNPPVPSPEQKAEVIKVLGWLYSVSPMAVSEAESRYGSKRLDELPGAQFEFSCSTPSTRRKFLSNLTYAAFDRPPTPTELGELGSAPDQPIGKDERVALVAKLRTTWKDAFVASGLRKLARYISGAGGIVIPPAVGGDGRGLSAAAVTDLKDELYASYKRHYDDTSYDDYFRSAKVAITANTAEPYGCVFRPELAVDGWDECSMAAPRNGFFTTLGFLNAKPSSFLEGNNNYGRVAQMYFTIFGETLRPDTAGPTGGEPKPLPACLEDADTRYLNGGPTGAAAVPNFGVICQTCHISRSMAAGAVLFRRFSLRGLQYTPDMFGAPPAEGLPFDAASFETATAPDAWALGPDHGEVKAERLGTAAMQAKLSALLVASTTAAKACIPTGRSDNPYVLVTDVSGFADYYLNLSPSGVARAFGRHANRAFANSNQVTFELAQALGDAYTSGRRQLPDLIETYFASETFACSQTE